MRIISEQDKVQLDNKTLTVELTGKEVGIVTAMLWNITADDVSEKIKHTLYKPLRQLGNQEVEDEELNELINGFEKAFESLL